MKVAITSYPMLWQRTGGLQVQILKTVEHLRAEGIDARVFDTLNDRFSNYDIVHVFSAINGTHVILREAQAQGARTVLSPILQPEKSRWTFRRYAIASWITGRLTGYDIRTTFDNIQSALKYSDRLIALSSEEEQVLTDGYGVDKRSISRISNGIDPAFFSAEPDLFLERHPTPGGFVLVVGSISPYKNQLGVIRQSNRPVVLIGPPSNKDYLAQCLEEGGERVVYIGSLAHDDPLLASAYAAAGVTVLASAGETFGLTAVESLAAGTPAIITKSNGLGLLPNPPYLQFIDPSNRSMLRSAIESATSAPTDARDRCRAMVAHLTWHQVSSSIAEVYKNLDISVR
ncbi:hypothetical protein CEW83_18835 [Parazoarcus communis]|uniref:Glycosyl transferase family 1 n=1 Tax=Parazoarcus communis TaxID=41977 RepID=A0A2U8GUT7_9RHOO|nr:glycosyltransferase family 4 protein [Parazoarcus communis]AWI77033.1 hypothetical protein CEW83_18835 [Parazoarcus communis]